MRGARRRAQAARVVSDAEIHALQFRGSARVSAYVATTLHAPDRVRALSDRSRTVADTAGARLRSVRGLVLLAMLALVAIGVRDLVFGRVAAVGTLLPWPGVGDLLRGYTSEWRYAALGAHAPAPPVFVLAALLRVVTLGAGGFARTLVVVGAIPLGMFGAFRLARSVAGRGWPPVVVAVVYGAVPLPRNAIELGHIGALVLYALAPLVVSAVFMLAGRRRAPVAAPPDRRARWRRRSRSRGLVAARDPAPAGARWSASRSRRRRAATVSRRCAAPAAPRSR